MRRRGSAPGWRWEANGGPGRGQSRFEGNGNVFRLRFWFAKAWEIGKNGAAKGINASLNLKNIRNFVCAASLLLAVWLGVTFVNKVPSHRYPTLGKDSVSLSAEPAPAQAAVSGQKSGLATVPLAR